MPAAILKDRFKEEESLPPRKKKKEFDLPKKVKEKLKDHERVKRELQEGKSAQDILEISDESMADFYQAAYKLFVGKRYTDAANAFLFLVTLNPYHHDYWMGLGMATQMCHEFESAIDAYEMAAICQVESPVPYFYLAKCLFAIHDRESALMALDLAIEYAADSDEFGEIHDQAVKAKAVLLKDQPHEE
ncbi:SycD/LcrH family type III secretion system chaperone [Estrella lausannensis]|uniref:Type III secretion chaperone SycD/LcrH n=1 Tax=Estrella lausannensis TaxID=483423 RepID=A0A0H5DQL2_9BACT|nr:SycD/LcrH family type III secretion system chaperone [Estrella lausannensis]CRX38373.1 type III secretion chaperone SycD/LcrH [Estrella lausannensis]